MAHPSAPPPPYMQTIEYEKDTRNTLDWILNILWIILGHGWLIALEWVLFGLLFCITIVGIPCGRECFKMAGLALFPFGKDIRWCERGRGCGPVGCAYHCANLIWFPLGICLMISHICAAGSLIITIIGIPFAIVHIKMALLGLWPFGADATANELIQETYYAV